MSGLESDGKPDRGGNPRPSGEAKREPRKWRRIRADDVDWTALSPEARETLRTFGVRLAFSHSYDEIAAETGATRNQIHDRLTALRREIREQLGQ